MVELLKTISEILLDNIYATEEQKIGDKAIIIEQINKIGKKTRLSLKFKILHNLKNHNTVYELRYCDEEHCFECLHELITEGSNQCEHEKKFTPYEVQHILWLHNKMNEEN